VRGFPETKAGWEYREISFGFPQPLLTAHAEPSSTTPSAPNAGPASKVPSTSQ
jgi:hypothetical protein